MRKPEAFGKEPEASGFVLMMVEFPFFNNAAIIYIAEHV